MDFENNSLFNFQTKTFMGLNAEYEVNQNLNVGATVLRLSERPLTQKTNIGDEPIANTIFGLNGTYTKETPFLTRAVDAIPFIDTKAKSTITVQGEYAQLVPGSPRGIEIGGEPTTYLDDFENSQTTIDIRNPRAWQLASVPGGQPELFPEADASDISYGYNRAKLAWYTIDPLFHGSDSRTPSYIKSNPQLQSEQYTRAVYIKEVFPKLEVDKSQAQNIAVLDLAYYPEEKGPYNFDVEPNLPVSAGIDDQGNLRDPASRWGGIMRDLSSTNFEEQNIEFIQFWMLDPFLEEGATDGGTLYFNLGSVSEDILKDGKQAIENGKPADGNLSKLDTTRWGYAPKVRPPVIAFDNDPASRNIQDVGYDLLSDAEEQNFTSTSGGQSYLNRIEQLYGQNLAYNVAKADPSSDNFLYYRDPLYSESDIRQRYKNYNNPEGNSDPTPIDGVSAFATNNPDIEDINGDQTLNTSETYYQYKVVLEPGQLDLSHPYITDIRDAESDPLPDNNKVLKSRWIQFRIPIFEPDRKVGPISDFRSIRFVRMFLKDFDEPVILRFARLELIRGEWRRYRFN
ncbi:MAG: cell surface protein SprA, partial [Owenweeksia sp.]